MIKLFRTFNPINILWLAVIMIVLRVGYVYSIPDRVDFPFAELFNRLNLPASYQYNIPPMANFLLTSVLVFGQALLLNYLVNHYNLLGRSTFLPALMYIVASGLFTPFLLIGSPLVCNFLVLWMLFKLFSFYKGDDA
ncbi:MAG TPA: hypothetical protein VHC47_08940, partial [Mucilaginibacter sp.]|nr:hypothetical protein [Mucilaginibacter sp.]